MGALTTGSAACAVACTANETAFRIDRPIAPARAPRVIALDERAGAVLTRLAQLPWARARFYSCPTAGTDTADPQSAWLRPLGGGTASTDEVLADADVVIVLATEDSGRAYAAALGRACRPRGITTAGIVLGDGFEADDAVVALRPYARVLLLGADESDAFELLTALRV